MPIKRHQRLPSTWRIMLNEYSERDINNAGIIVPSHRPYGGNINDYRFGRPGREYAVTDDCEVGGAYMGASDYDDTDPRAVERWKEEQKMLAEQQRYEELQRRVQQQNGKRYRKRSELNVLSGITSAHTKPTAAPSSSPRSYSQHHSFQQQYFTLSTQAALSPTSPVPADGSSPHQQLANPVHTVPMQQRPQNPLLPVFSRTSEAERNAFTRHMTEGAQQQQQSSMLMLQQQQQALPSSMLMLQQQQQHSAMMAGGGAGMLGGGFRVAYPREIPRTAHAIH